MNTPHVIRTNAGLLMPRIIYGTAWKEERTAELVVKAVLAGFRGIDTACQPRHYREDLVGSALNELQKKHSIKREDLFVQTKFSPLPAHEPHNIPYDKNASLPEQVRQSLKKSLENLRTDYIDSIVMHSPMRTVAETMKVWCEFEGFVAHGKVKQLGISNIYNLRDLEEIYNKAKIKPAVIQNRFYADTDYDIRIRDFCTENGIIYQSFWTLTANPHLLKSDVIRKIAVARQWTPAQVLFRYLI
eukprot:Colp12_sorted_trinity150504_noHs@6400